MRCRRFLPIVLGLIAWLPSAAIAADGPAVMAAVRANQWAQAKQLADKFPDPVAAKLVTFYRLLDPDAASAAEIAAFTAANPDWPYGRVLALRRDQALATEPDATLANRLCQEQPPTLAAALLRCAQAAAPHDAALALDDLRQAWRHGVAESALSDPALTRLAGGLTAEDQWRRYLWLAARAPAAAAAQLARLTPPQRQAAAVLRALRDNQPEALADLAALPEALRADPAIRHARIDWLLHQDELDSAKALLMKTNLAKPPDPALTAERLRLARLLLVSGDNQDAYALAARAAAAAGSIDQSADAIFLAGWIALRRTGAPDAAAAQFQHLARLSHAAITQGRAEYWLGRAEQAAGHPDAARTAWRAAAGWATTYYGQLAALALHPDPAALNRRIDALRDPGWTQPQALAFAGQQVARAAALLVAWGDPHRARAFLLRLQTLAVTPAQHALGAQLAVGLGLPESAVAGARLAGVHGVMLPQLGWPTPYQVPSNILAPPLGLAIMRQESNFAPDARSRVGALGLMQLMPATARKVAAGLGARFSIGALTAEPSLNIELGSTYLAQLLTRFDGAIPLAAAAYNAGPRRVDAWLADNGDPRAGGPDMIDWIELIPFNETRNYVQRVIESLEIYRAREGIIAPDPALLPAPPAAAP